MSEEKLIPKGYLVMDINAIPHEHGVDGDRWAEFIIRQGLVVYDSHRGETPKLTDPDVELRIVDINQLEFNFEDDNSKQ